MSIVINKENYMQLAITLPDELGKKILQHSNIEEFVRVAIERMLLEEKLSENISIPPKTKSLIGLISHCSIEEEEEYKKYLEGKYL